MHLLSLLPRSGSGVGSCSNVHGLVYSILIVKFTRLRGFQDLIGAQAETLTYVEDRARTVAERYGFREIRIPILERAQLYERSTGETSDIVSKQMYEVKRHDDTAA